VHRGFTQQPGIDFSETFSPVVKLATIHTILSIALSHNWSIHQLDVKNAFLHDTPLETIYCMQPSGFVDSSHPDYVCHLNRSLIGLKQAPCLVHLLCFSYFISWLCCAQSDTSLFAYRHGLDTVYLLL
jgi:hypothetical protein